MNSQKPPQNEIYQARIKQLENQIFVLEERHQQDLEELLITNEREYQRIFESFQDIYFRTDSSGKITIVSPSIVTFTGYTPEEVIGRDITDFNHDKSDLKKLSKILNESLTVNDYELKIVNKKKEVKDFSLNSRIIFDESENSVGVEGVLRDIKQRKNSRLKIGSSKTNLF